MIHTSLRNPIASVSTLIILLALVSCSEPTQETPKGGDGVAADLAQASPAAARKDIVNTEKKLYSQYREELVIRDFFQDRRDGFFLDVGCALPREKSTTYYLEKHLGWKGIGVDAVAEYATTWKKYRPDATFLNFLVTDHSDTEDQFYRAGWWEVSSAKKEMVDKTGGPYEERTVMTATIDRILETQKVEKLDFLSMDIEGAQLEALAGFSIEKHKPELVCIEAYAPARPEILKYFVSHGYERLDQYLEHDKVNWYFAPKRGK